MSIQQFYQAAVGNDFARTFQFRVENMRLGAPAIGGTKAVDFTYSSTQQNAGGQNLYIETAALPGRIINNIPVPFMGLSFNVPGTASFPGSANYAITFRCDQNYAIRQSLEEALVNTFSIATTSGNYSTPNLSNYIQMTLFGKEAGLGESGTPSAVRTYRLEGVYLTALQDTVYDVKDVGNVALINATIAYQYWTVASGTTAPAGVDEFGGSITGFTAPNAAALTE